MSTCGTTALSEVDTRGVAAPSAEFVDHPELVAEQTKGEKLVRRLQLRDMEDGMNGG